QLTSPQGEFTVVVPFVESSEKQALPVGNDVLKVEIGRLIENGALSRREAARAVGARFGLSTKQVYDATKD
ncbi:MAG: hypothetical protein OEW19_15230, partial [Acidobacteriota bacterium]|nr:hypothetical protein [Acidobacteriota bacterium]